jgi:hypothetical protein
VGFGAFLIFAVTMGLLVFLLAFLGATSGPALTRSLRVGGRRVQVVTALVIVLVGAALVYSGANPGVFDRLILAS